MPNDGIYVENWRQVNALFAKADKGSRREFRAKLRALAEPIRSDAQSLAFSQISGIGPKWSRMRVGVTRNLVYVAPRQRGLRGPSPRHRRNLATLLLTRSMRPAYERHKAGIAPAVEHLFSEIASDFNRHA